MVEAKSMAEIIQRECVEEGDKRTREGRKTLTFKGQAKKELEETGRNGQSGK